jgi:hypothetical protein
LKSTSSANPKSKEVQDEKNGTERLRRSKTDVSSEGDWDDATRDKVNGRLARKEREERHERQDREKRELENDRKIERWETKGRETERRKRTRARARAKER